MKTRDDWGGGRATSSSPFATAGLLAGAILLIAGLLVGGFVWLQTQRASFPNPNPTGATAKESDFPQVDWAYWTEVNPDVIAWVSVPDTPVSLPVVRAHKADPDFYLSHDVFGEENINGAIYLDAECGALGAGESNSIIYGHNMGWTQAMFAPLARYSEPDFAQSHSAILLQTPEQQLRLSVRAVRVVNGYTETKRTAFESRGELRAWWADLYRASSPVSTRAGSWEEAGTWGSEPIRCVFTFCTCSYTRFESERTLVYALPD